MKTGAGKVSFDLAANLLCNLFRDANPIGGGKGLKTGSNVNAVAKDVAFFQYHIAEADTDPKGHSLGFGQAIV